MADTRPPSQRDPIVFSTEQMAQIERLIETADHDLVYYRLSNRVIKRVSQLIGTAALVLLGVIAWFGYETKSDIDEEINAQIDAQVGQALTTYISKNSESISNTLKKEVQKQIEPIVTERINGLLSNEIEPELADRIEDFQSEISDIESAAFDELRVRAVKLFPALDALEKLEDSTGDFPAAFSELASSANLAEIRSASNQNILNALAEEEIPNMLQVISKQADQIELLSLQLNRAEEKVTQLEDSIGSIGDIERATISMCRFYALVSPDVLAELFDDEPPNNNPELAAEFENVLSKILGACRTL